MEIKIPDEVLRPFQQEAVALHAKEKRGILGHQTGLGKTVIALATLERAIEGDNPKILVLGSKSSFATWKNLLKKWWNVEPQFIRGQSTQRTKIWAKAELGIGGVYVMTYQTFLADFAKSPRRWAWDAVVCDEAHKFLRNRQNKTYKAVHKLRGCRVFLAMSATVASRGPQDLWGLLHLCNPSLFPSYWKFVNTFCYVVDTPFGKEIGGVRNLEALRNILTRYYTRATYQEVAPQMPPISRVPITVEMTPEQQKAYIELSTNLIAIIEEDIVMSPGSLALMVKLRQLSVVPWLVHPSLGNGGPVEYILDQLEEDPHTVIFCPFPSAFDHLKTVLQNSGYPYVQILRGGMEPEEVNEVIDEFKRTRGIALVSIKFAESFDLSSVRVAYMLGFEWDPNDNVQAEGRLKRLDSENFQGVVVNYLISEGTVDEAVREVVEGKSANVRKFMDPKFLRGVLTGTQ